MTLDLIYKKAEQYVAATVKETGLPESRVLLDSIFQMKCMLNRLKKKPRLDIQG